MEKKLIDFYNEYKHICAAYHLAQSTLYFDMATVAPKNGIAYRNEMMAILAGEAFSYEMNPKNLKKIEELYYSLEDNEDLKKELSLFFRSLEMTRQLPKDVYIRITKTEADSEEAWHKAKENNDYSLFKDHLIRVINAKKEVLNYLDKSCSDYDYLLDQHEMGTNQKMYDEFFYLIKKELLPLIQRIQKAKQIDNSILLEKYDVNEQELFMRELCDYMQINRDECSIGTTEHPFTSFFSAHEARITTHYYENNILSAILSTIHEYGHALYSLQVNEDYDGTPFKNCIGYAMHESQSRFMENHIGRHPSFWKINYPKLQKHFPKQLSHVSYEEFMKMMNLSQPSLIRIEADELTYPIHILIRYELEKDIFNGNVDIEQLDQLWNDKYEEYLEIRPQNDCQGILQDIHWTNSFGYFPTYALGSAYAAQFYHAMEKELDVDSILEQGQFNKITDWLKTHIHQYGAYKTANEILVSATGEPFNPLYYIDYLKNKYMKLYHITK